MKKILERISQYADHLTKIALVAFLMAAFLCTLYQVLSRYVLQSLAAKWGALEFLVRLNFPWMEEFIRYLFIWTVFLGIPVVYKMKGHAQVEILTAYLPGRIKRLAALVVELLNILFFLILTVSGTNILKIVTTQVSASLRINMAWMYSAVVVCSVVCLLHALVFLVNDIGKNAGHPGGATSSAAESN